MEWKIRITTDAGERFVVKESFATLGEARRHMRELHGEHERPEGVREVHYYDKEKTQRSYVIRGAKKGS